MRSDPQSNAAQSRLGFIANAVAALVIAVMAALSLSAFPAFWYSNIYGDFGFTTGQGGGPIQGTTVTAVSAGSPAGRAGIKLGDTLDRPTALYDRLLLSGLALPRPGERIMIPVVREGTRRLVRLQARSILPLSAIGRATDVLLVVVLLTYVAVGLGLVLLRPARMTWGFYLFAFALISGSSACDCWGYFSQKIPANWLVAVQIIPLAVLLGFGVVGFLVFFLRFPTNTPSGWRMVLDSITPYLALALAGVSVARDLSLIGFKSKITDRLTHVFDVMGFPIVIIATVVFFTTYVTARGLERHRIKWVVLGVVCALVPLAALFLSLEGLLNAPDWVSDLLNLLYLPLPLAIAYAVLRHRVIDLRFVLSRSLVVGVIAAMIAFIVICLDWLFSTRLPTSRFELAIIAGVAILVGFSLNAARQHVARTIDFLFFRQWHQTQEQVETIADALRRATSKADLCKPLTSGIARAFSLASAALFERVEDGGFVRIAAYAWPVGTLWHILLHDPIVLRVNENARVTDIDAFQWQERAVPAGVARPVVMVPITMGRQVPAILLCGAHENGMSLDSDEIRSIRRLCDDAGLLYGKSSSDLERTTFATARLGVQL
jgi:hypothetical protein